MRTMAAGTALQKGTRPIGARFIALCNRAGSILFTIARRPVGFCYIYRMESSSGWLFWALLSALFAALTAIFAKIGIQQVDSDLATLIRTIVLIVPLALFVWLSGKWTSPLQLSGKTLVFLTLSALATGASWVCYFRALQLGDASRVAPVDKLSVLLVAVFAFAVLGERPTLREWSGIGLVGAGVLLLAIRR